MHLDLPEHDLQFDRRCWSTLAVLTFAMAVAAAYRLGWLALYYTGRLPLLGAFFGYEGLDFWLRTIAHWPKVMAALALLGVSSDLGWRRRGFFFLICTLIDSLLWVVEHSNELGLSGEDDPFPAWLRSGDWLRYAIGTAVGWSEFQLIAAMAGEIAVAYKHERAEAFAKSIRSLASVGTYLWAFFYISATHWGRPGAFRGPRLTPQTFLLWQAVRLVWTVCLVQITALCFQALSACAAEIRAETKRRRDQESSHFDF